MTAPGMATRGVRTLRALAGVLALMALAGWTRLAAQDLSRGRDDTQAQRLFGEFMSPFCPGLTVATCPSPGADSLRRDIRMRLDRGETPALIREAYAAAWGEQILGAPKARSWGLALWMAPLLALLAGALGVRRWLVRHREPALDAPAPGAEPPHLSPDEERQLAAELRDFEA